MEDPVELALTQWKPFGVPTNELWQRLAVRLLDSFSRFLGVRMEMAGEQEPVDPDCFVPLIRSAGDLLPAVGVRFAGMLYCAVEGKSQSLRLEVLLIAFIGRERVGPERREYLLFKFRGENATPEWESCGWCTSDDAETWDRYPHAMFFGDPA